MENLEARRREKGILTEEDIYDQFDPEQFVDNQFKAFSIADLRDHQQAILNMFHQYSDKQVDKDDIISDLHADQQEQIKRALPSFKERMAFVNALKRRWKEQKGFCSVFDRARAQKLKKEKKELKSFMRKIIKKQDNEDLRTHMPSLTPKTHTQHVLIEK